MNWFVSPSLGCVHGGSIGSRCPNLSDGDFVVALSSNTVQTLVDDIIVASLANQSLLHSPPACHPAPVSPPRRRQIVVYPTAPVPASPIAASLESMSDDKAAIWDVSFSFIADMAVRRMEHILL